MNRLCGLLGPGTRPWEKAGAGDSALSQRAASHRLVPVMFCEVFRQLATPKNTGVRLWLPRSTGHLGPGDLFPR